MARAKKRDDRVVLYVRVKLAEQAKLAKIVEKRGYPHTIASVAGELLARGLESEAS